MKTAKTIHSIQYFNKSKSRKIDIYEDDTDPYNHRTVTHYDFFFKTFKSKFPYEYSVSTVTIRMDRSNPDYKTNSDTDYSSTSYEDDITKVKQLYKELTADLNKLVIEIDNNANFYTVKLDNAGEKIFNPDAKHITII